jgi:hypothetical protein
MDCYSKIVLTIIAIALSSFVLQNAGILPSMKSVSFSTPALASGDIQKMQICSLNNTTAEWDCARVQGGRLSVKTD